MPMLSTRQIETGVEFRIKEPCGLDHLCQTVERDVPGSLSDPLVFRDRVSGSVHPAQISRSMAGKAVV